MNECKPLKTWEKTRLKNLLRHKSGVYYARTILQGKQIWQSLKTTHFSIAAAEHAKVMAEHRKKKARRADPADRNVTFGSVASALLDGIEAEVETKRATKKYAREVHAALLKSWPDLADTPIRRISEEACKRWAAKYAKQVSPTRYNGTVSFLRRAIGLAVKSGAVTINAAEELGRRTPRAKHLELPTREQFAAFIAEMRAGHSRDSRNCADLAEGLAYTGCRISEAGELTWKDVDFTRGEIHVKGDPEEATKNSETRRLPMIPSARKLFERMRIERDGEAEEEKVFLVRECQGAMNRSAQKVGMKRITHHDLRHYFATVCIESGVDIPTVSRWLGHKDGGALAMKTYGHLRDEHSQAAALKVSFEPAPAANVLPFEQPPVAAVV